MAKNSLSPIFNSTFLISFWDVRSSAIMPVFPPSLLKKIQAAFCGPSEYLKPLAWTSFQEISTFSAFLQQHPTCRSKSPYCTPMISLATPTNPWAKATKICPLDAIERRSLKQRWQQGHIPHKGICTLFLPAWAGNSLHAVTSSASYWVPGVPHLYTWISLLWLYCICTHFIQDSWNNRVYQLFTNNSHWIG